MRARVYLGRSRSYLLETPPYCPTAACSVHYVWGRALEVEHHVPECPMAGTLAAQTHRLDHALRDTGRELWAAILGIFGGR